MRTPVLFALFFALLFVMPQTVLSAAKNNPSPFEIDKLDKNRANDFTLSDLTGRNVSLSSFKGRVIVLSFWATWCPPCIEEMASLNSLAKDKHMAEKGLDIIAVSTDTSTEGVKAFAEKRGLVLRILMDLERKVTRDYKVFSLPTTFLIDKNGIIVEKFFGEYDWTSAEMRKKIQKLF